MIKLTNTLTRKKEEFKPIDPKNVGMYVCGVTPYDHSHIGHARAYVTFDILYRLLRQTYGEKHVKYVRNFTDIDDKIINRANDLGENPLDLATRYIASFHEDMASLNCLKPNVEPRVTTEILEIIEFITDLVSKNFAYPTPSGDVYFDVTKADGYGKLSGKKLDELQAGARVAVNVEKKNAGDFALWKSAKAGEPSWDSPWGQGRPGWHIECSAMSKKYMGEKFDIHGGGEDLQFPHHENEIAQSEAECGHKHVSVWLHNAFITVEGKKMSKSLGNFTPIKDVLKNYSGEAIRLWLMQTHYRKPVDFSEMALEAAENRLKKYVGGMFTIGKDMDEVEIPQEFFDALSNDLNVSKALAVMDNNDVFIRDKCLKFLGCHPSQGEKIALNDNQQQLISTRNEVRKNKDWAESDRIRDELVEQGIILEDRPDGTTIWRRK